MRVYAVAVDFEDLTTKYRVVETESGFSVHSLTVGGGMPQQKLFHLKDHTDEVSCYLAAMTEWMEMVSAMTADIKPAGKKPLGFSLAMFTDAPSDEYWEQEDHRNVYMCKGATAQEAAASLAATVDDVGEWDFSELLDMGLPASIIALGENLDGATEVWVELTIE